MYVHTEWTESATTFDETKSVLLCFYLTVLFFQHQSVIYIGGLRMHLLK